MRIIVAGGTGFIGRVLVRGLIEDGHQVVMLCRPRSKADTRTMPGIEIAAADSENPIPSDFDGDAIINLVGIIREFPSRGITFQRSHFLVTRNLVDLAKRVRIPRFLQMSALGVKPEVATGYLKTKYAAEVCVRDSGLNWTIFRPSIVIGQGGGLFELLTKMIKQLPVVPVVGDGQYKVQPVNIDDVIAGFRKSLGNERASGKIFEFGGPEIMTYDKMLDELGSAIGHPKVRKWHQPLWMVRLMAALLGRFPWFPLTIDQITMLLENNYTDDRSYYQTFGIEPRSIRDGLKVSSEGI